MDDDPDKLAPKKRADCEKGLRPCPWLRCVYHMFWVKEDLTIINGTNRGKLGQKKNSVLRILNKKTDEEILHEIFSFKHTCVLDVADHGGQTLQELADTLEVTRERIRQIEGFKHGGGLRRLRRQKHMFEGFVE